MPTISEPEPEQAGMEAAAVELVELLESDHQAVVEQALQAVLGYSDDPEGIALLRDLPPPAAAPQSLLQLAVRSVSQPKLRTDAVVALVNLSSDAAIAAELSQAGAAATGLALAAAAGSGATGGGVAAQHRLLQLCCNLTRNNSAVAALLGGEEDGSGKATDQLGRITEQLLAAVDAGDAAALPALGALLRMLTNVTAEPDGQAYAMTLLGSLLRESVVQSEDDDVRAGLCVAISIDHTCACEAHSSQRRSSALLVTLRRRACNSHRYGRRLFFCACCCWVDVRACMRLLG
jgi:hypothetical protein